MLTLVQANALRIPLADRSVQCCVTSPPYYGLRDYNVDGQIGLEATPERYVAALVLVFREVRRVLRDDGTLWLVIGDSYAGSGKGHTKHGTLEGYKQATNAGSLTGMTAYVGDGYKPKDLIGIPWRVAFALQADGWWLRSDVIWHKPNPMPESVRDRPTSAHEYVFLLTKSARYYYDAEAVKEPLAESTLADKRNSTGRHTQGKVASKYYDDASPDGTAPDKPSWYRAKTFVNASEGRNLRSVWTIPTKPYKGAHFATYPPALVEPCIKAGTSERGACPKCGKPWERVVERAVIGYSPSPRSNGNKDRNDAQDGRTERQSTTIGWRPGCDCYGTVPFPEYPDQDKGESNEVYRERIEPIRAQRLALLEEWKDLATEPCVVLDPFAGSGTTLLVARDLGRDAVGLDLSYAYLHDQARVRLGLDALDAWQSDAAIDGDCEPLDALPLFAAQEAR